jgi:hypothetical protein
MKIRNKKPINKRPRIEETPQKFVAKRIFKRLLT